MRIHGFSLLLVSAALLSACCGLRSGTDAIEPLVPREASGFHAMNAITPYHHWGAGGDVRAQAVAAMQANLDAAKDAGAESVRIDLWWGIIEPEKGVFDWEITDAVVSSMVERGIEPYPILCYQSTWAKEGESPANETEWDEFANYAGSVAARYADDLYYYEVWNEPNIVPFWTPAPDAEDYAELLKRTYAAVKAADPDSMVVAMCTAGADYSFIEAVYRAGGAEFCDAISWHHYSATADEADIEGEISGVREIMRRYGDEGKPLFLTESGLSTGDSTVQPEVGHDFQARWIVKKHLIALSRGVEKFYYFKLQDDTAESAPDGYWGLIEHDRDLKPSWHAYRAMTERVGSARYLGNVWAAEVHRTRAKDAELQVYRRSDGEVFAAGWARADGDDLVVRLPADADGLRVEAMDGSLVGRVKPDASGHANVTLTKEPRYLRGLGNEGLLLAGTRFDPPAVRISPGHKTDVRLVAENPTGDAVTLDLAKLTNPPGDFGITLDGLPASLVVPARSTVERNFTVALAADVRPFRRARIVGNHDSDVTWWFEVVYEAPFAIGLSPGGGNGTVTVDAEVRNALTEPADGSMTWRVNGIEQTTRETFDGLSRHETHASAKFAFGPNEGENVVACVADNQFGGSTMETVRVFGQEMTADAPVIDGVFGDWNDPPVLRMRRSKQRAQQKAALPFDTDDEFAGNLRVLWTRDTVFIGAEVTDSTPLVNPHKGPDAWKGDALEVYIGFTGPTASTVYPKGFHQLVISPGDEGAGGFAWNFKSLNAADHPDGKLVEAAQVAASRTDSGYIVEAAIPLSEFAVTAQVGDVLAFDVHINNKFSRDSETNDAVLIWNGDGDNWRDPTDWGVAVVLQNPADRPSTKRGQLHGGETERKVSDDPTGDRAFLTPLPVEYPDMAAHLPSRLALSLPFDGRYEIATGYGFESDSWTHQTIGNARSANDFYAIDINVPMGTPVLAAADGRIAQSNRRGDSYGNYVVIDHGEGYQTIYAHLNRRQFDVDLGEPVRLVKRGDVIGWSGRSGTSWPHLHFAVHENARASHSGANVAGKAVCPEPLGGYYGVREGQWLESGQ